MSSFARSRFVTGDYISVIFRRFYDRYALLPVPSQKPNLREVGFEGGGAPIYTHMHAWRGRVGAAAWRRCVLVAPLRACGAAACLVDQLVCVLAALPCLPAGTVGWRGAMLSCVPSMAAGGMRDCASRRSRWARRWAEGLGAEPMRAREGGRNSGRGRRASVRAECVRGRRWFTRSVCAGDVHARGCGAVEACGRQCERLVRATGTWMRSGGRRSPGGVAVVCMCVLVWHEVVGTL